MATSPSRPRRLLVGLLPLAIVASALPLLAPTCGSTDEGPKTFARRSLIIPMDRCYQSQTDGVSSTTQPATCPQAVDPGDVIRAYGLVYQLIRNDVAVYWVIEDSKTAAEAEDFNIQYDGGFPAYLFDWNTGGTGNPPTNQHVIRYRGGPFVVDGSDYDRAAAVLQQYRANFANVNVHVANVAFQGFVKKVMAGGWSAGGTVPPKLALLDIGSGNLQSSGSVSDPKNAEPVIAGYLSRAGIGSGTAAGSAEGPHGEIYDKLDLDDFQPAVGSTDWRTSRFGQNGYQILWVPHWLAAGSCSNYSSSTNCTATLYPTAKTDQVLKTIGGWVAAGGDLFAECAGIGSFEGTFRRSSSQNTTTYTTDYPAPCDDAATPATELCDPSTRFQSTTGMRYSVDGNEVSFGTPIRFPDVTSFASPLMQIGDFTFKPVLGAIDVYRPNVTAASPNTGAYQPGTVRLIASSGADELWDFFTMRPSQGDRGSIVYLGGHSYSGVQGGFQIGGTRLVLNTLFNLGAGCTESGVACDTGKLGVCARGQLTCVDPDPTDADNSPPYCRQLVEESDEICNGLDDDCNGLVDEDLEEGCYDGPGGTENVGLCRAGIRQCERNPDGSYGMSACRQAVLPAEEVCNGLDDDCDGTADGLSEACYDGPPSSWDQETNQPKGTCKPGLRTCTAGNWGECVGDVLPVPEVCTEGPGTPGDEDCNGLVDDANCTCTVGVPDRPCYGGPAGTAGVGLCHAGLQTCTAAGWGACAGEQTPSAEVCTNPGQEEFDEDCDGQTDEGCGCKVGQTETCYTGPAGTADVGVCRSGERACVSGVFAGECVGDITPAAGEACDGQDNDCDGSTDENAACASGYQCNAGVCVPAVCGTERPCPEGTECQGALGCRAVAGTCGESAPGAHDGETCDAGEACRFGHCVDPCDGVVCGEGAVCASGACVGGACYFTGCDEGQLCRDGTCQPDPCADVNCPSGTFCREGYCVQACTFVTCKAGERCGEDGFCAVDPCAGKTCSAGNVCENGQCVADLCASVGCGTGQVCRQGTCVDDPCAGVKCAAGTCSNGQCYSVGNPNGAGGNPRAEGSSGGCGCGAGGGVGPLGALLGLLAVPLARRRRPRRAGGGRGALLVLAISALAVAGGCKEEKKFDPAKCAAACEGVKHCVDHLTDALNCGSCGQTCGEGNKCVDGVCGPTSAVAPRIGGFTPAAVSNGSPEPRPLTVTGERFQPGAKLRAVTSSGAILVDTTFVSSTQLTAALDLEEEPPTTWSVRVLNPDNVISNARPLDVVVPSPQITSVTPPQVTSGTTETFVVSGEGLGVSSQCRISSGTLLETALPSEPGEAAGTLECALDARLLAPGSYQLWVVNNGTLSSTKLPFQIVSPTPALTAISPSAGESGEILSVTAVGTGFDPTSKVLFDGVAVDTTFLGPALLLVPWLQLPSCGAGTCDHAVRVRNGGDTSTLLSNTLVLKAGAAPVTVSGISPGTGYQGTSVTITLTGSGFADGSVLEAAPPGGTFTALASNVDNCPTCTTVSGVLDLVGEPEGSWLVRAKAPDGTSTVTFTFRVLSNQATLRDASPRGAPQGPPSPVTVTLTVANLQTPYADVRVLFAPAGAADGTETVLTPSTPPTATTVTAVLPLAGKNTGGYELSVRNPNGAPESNELSFNVTPGFPTVGTVTPASAPRSETPVTVVITGTNFAKPDAQGNGGSAVYITHQDPTIGVVDYPISREVTTVVNHDRIELRLDTRDAIPGVYSLSVWNPGGDPPPQKSVPKANAFTVLP